MSFRSRSHAKPVAPPRRRSSSLTRNSATSSSYTAPSSSARPYSSIHGSALNFSSPQNNYMYGSNQNLRMSGTDYYGNGSDYRRNSYTQPNGTLKFPMTTMSTGGSSSSSSAAYTSPYKDRYPNSYLSNGSSGYTSAYKDRGYYNPYTSYDNGVTTASLSIPMANSGSSVKRDYAPIRSSNLLSASSNGLGGSNTSLMGNGQSINDKVANIGRSQSLREHERKNRSRKCKEAAKVAVPDTSVPYDYEVAAGSGSSSNLSVAQKSLSVLSLHSEGYEVRMLFGATIDMKFCNLMDVQSNFNGLISIINNYFSLALFQSGNESRSRAESLASSALGDANDDGEFVDYKALYEAAKYDNKRFNVHF